MAAVRSVRDSKPPASSALAPLLLPVARLWLQAGGSIADFDELARRAFVLAAGEQAQMRSGRVNLSAVATRTGLSRAEVHRLSQPAEAQPAVDGAASRVARVLDGWRRDPRFLTAAGQPRSLPIKGDKGSFHQLVRLYSGDIPPRPILREMLRLGLARNSAAGRVVVSRPDRRARAQVDAASSSLQLLQGLLAAVPPRALELPDLQPCVVAIPVANSRRVRQVGREALQRLDAQLQGLKAALADALPIRRTGPAGRNKPDAGPQLLLLSLAAWLPR